jgi:two-component system chemotaxis sensor kinase CheA
LPSILSISDIETMPRKTRATWRRTWFDIVGGQVELDRSVLDKMMAPLEHMLRNAVTHGIETRAERVAAGKPEIGDITVSLAQEGNEIILAMADDGRGLDRDRIRARAEGLGLLEPGQEVDDARLYDLIFLPGFSTAGEVSQLAGRGVGMDVVKRNITAMGGRVEIESMTGIGTRITVRLPLTLAILDGMSVGVGSETYILPLNHVVESLQPLAGQIRTISGTERVLQVRGEYLPVIALHELFGCRNAQHDFARGIMIVLEADGKPVSETWLYRWTP